MIQILVIDLIPFQCYGQNFKDWKLGNCSSKDASNVFVSNCSSKDLLKLQNLYIALMFDACCFA